MLIVNVLSLLLSQTTEAREERSVWEEKNERRRMEKARREYRKLCVCVVGRGGAMFLAMDRNVSYALKV